MGKLDRSQSEMDAQTAVQRCWATLYLIDLDTAISWKFPNFVKKHSLISQRRFEVFSFFLDL